MEGLGASLASEFLRHCVVLVEPSGALLPSAGQEWKCRLKAPGVEASAAVVSGGTARLLAGGAFVTQFKLAVQRQSSTRINF